MIKLTEQFTAQQVRLMQNGAEKLISYINEQIIESAGQGNFETFIYAGRNPVLDYSDTWAIAQPVGRYFESRGFKVTLEPQSGFRINWQEK